MINYDALRGFEATSLLEFEGEWVDAVRRDRAERRLRMEEKKERKRRRKRRKRREK
jgi:hypothetical protein